MYQLGFQLNMLLQIHNITILLILFYIQVFIYKFYSTIKYTQIKMKRQNAPNTIIKYSFFFIRC